MMPPMSKSKAVVEALQRIGFGYELLGANPMRTRAYVNGARTVKKLGNRLEEAYASGELAKVKGIGKGLLETIGAVLEGRQVAALDEVESKIPAGLFEVRRIPGLGPKKIGVLWKELGLTSVPEIEYACNENRLVELSGFGPLTQDKVKEAIVALAQTAGRYRLDQAAEAWAFVAHAVDAELVGEFRRGCESVTEVAAVAAGLSMDAAADAMHSVADTVLVAGDTVKCSVASIPVRLIVVADPADLGAAVAWHTGSDQHVEQLVRRAASGGLELSQEGLREGGALVSCPDEASLYAALGLQAPPAERREAGLPLVDAGAAAEALVTREDLQGALHNHTTASDGISSLSAMRAAAGAAGLRYLGISDHSQSAGYAGGLPPQVLLGQVATILAMNGEADAPCQLLTGVESDILGDGGLDYEPDVLAALDVVIASVHARSRLDRTAMTARMIKAARDPWSDVIGHPTGRLILGRAASDYDVPAFLNACAESGCAVELNANPQRLDLDEGHLAMAKARGIKVSIAADAHSVAALDHLDYGVIVARRAGLTADDVLNAMPLPALRSWLADRRSRR